MGCFRRVLAATNLILAADDLPWLANGKAIVGEAHRWLALYFRMEEEIE
jgi:hypothetical protein